MHILVSGGLSLMAYFAWERGCEKTKTLNIWYATMGLQVVEMRYDNFQSFDWAVDFTLSRSVYKDSCLLQRALKMHGCSTTLYRHW